MKLALRKWQTQLLSLLIGEYTSYFTNRKVIWIQDTAGNAGKSTFIRYLAMNEKDYGIGIEKLPIDHPDRLRSAVIKLAKKKDVDLYMFDFTRTQGQDTHYTDLFEVIEEIKNSYVVDVMYGNFNKAFLKPATVIIFTNNRINDFKKYLSLDRWAAFSIQKDQSLNYLDLSNIMASQDPDEIPFEQYITTKLENRSNI